MTNQDPGKYIKIVSPAHDIFVLAPGGKLFKLARAGRKRLKLFLSEDGPLPDDLAEFVFEPLLRNAIHHGAYINLNIDAVRSAVASFTQMLGTLDLGSRDKRAVDVLRNSWRGTALKVDVYRDFDFTPLEPLQRLPQFALFYFCDEICRKRYKKPLIDAVRQGQRSLNQESISLELRESALQILQRISESRKDMTVQGLSNVVKLQPIQFASVLGQLSRDGFVQVRGETCRKLLLDANAATEQAGLLGQDYIATWAEYLINLAAKETLMRTTGTLTRAKKPDLLKVATAPVRLTKKAENYLWQRQQSQSRGLIT